jgi:hypothetical protein
MGKGKRAIPPRRVGPSELANVKSRIKKQGVSDEDLVRILSFTTNDVSMDKEEGCNLCNAACCKKKGQIEPRKGQDHRKIWFEERWVYANQLFWVLLKGPIPEGKHVLHTCHDSNGRCVNINHLKIGTKGKNTRECVLSGRNAVNILRGEQNGKSKLTDEKVREIRRLAKTQTQTSIARDFGVNFTTVNAIVNKRAWAHVSD